jgi:hypothetical protein
MSRANEEPADDSANEATAFRPSRRAILRGGLGAAGIGLLTTGGRTRTVAGQGTPIATPVASANQPSADVVVFPRPGARTASPGTEITFRGVRADELGTVEVVGAESGAHSGVLAPHADGRGVSFLPDAPFLPRESVTVRAGLPLGASGDEAMTFIVAQPAVPPRVAETREPEEPVTEPRTFRSRPDLRPPAIRVTTPATKTAPGLIFLGVKTPNNQNGAMIVDDEGEQIWFSPMTGDVDQPNDVRVQWYRGQPVLTSWEGVSERGHGLGHFVVRDSSYRPVAELRVGNGYPGADLHEFLLTPDGTALIIVYHAVRWDLSSVGGAEEGTAVDGIVQELEVATGRVISEWHSLDHIAIDEAKGEPPEDPDDLFDYVHLNSVEVDADGHLVVSARNSWGVYKFDRWTGEVIWRLNGTRSDFEMGPETPFVVQHDARVLPTGELTVFDNASGDSEAEVSSRGLVLRLDTEAMTATLVRAHVHPTEILSVSQGNMQTLPNGNAFVGWGSSPVFSEFAPDGTLLFNGRFPQNTNSYRAYRFPWVGLPSELPAVATELGDDGEVTVYVSWNGATEAVTWEVLAGSNPDRLRPVASAPRAGFETEIVVETTEPYLAVRALNGTGNILGVSAVVEPGAEDADG